MEEEEEEDGMTAEQQGMPWNNTVTLAKLIHLISPDENVNADSESHAQGYQATIIR